MKGLRKRAISAVIFVALVLGGLIGGPIPFFILFTFVTGICLIEFFHLVLIRNKRRDKIRIGLGVTLGLLPHLFVSALALEWIPTRESLILAVSLAFFPLLFLMLVYELFAAAKRPFENVALLVLGMVYIGAPFATLNLVAYRSGTFDWQIIFGILTLTWLSDTGAYVAGNLFGKTPLFTRISPNKTWEGFIGGAIVVLLSAWLIDVILPVLNSAQWLILGILVVIFGSLGDLVESMLKRSLGVKDSGRILPGHGGLLDRFDAFIFLIPFVSAYLVFIR